MASPSICSGFSPASAIARRARSAAWSRGKVRGSEARRSGLYCAQPTIAAKPWTPIPRLPDGEPVERSTFDPLLSPGAAERLPPSPLRVSVLCGGRYSSTMTDAIANADAPRDQLFQQALSLHQRGDIEAALQAYEAILSA